MSTDLALSIFCPLFLGLGILLGHTSFKLLRKDDFSRETRKILAYTHTLLGNCHAAHKTSPLTGTEIEEVLRLCKDELDKVLRA